MLAGAAVPLGGTSKPTPEDGDAMQVDAGPGRLSQGATSLTGGGDRHRPSSRSGPPEDRPAPCEAGSVLQEGAGDYGVGQG